MSINLNHSIYGAQFNAFRDLASQANLAQDTLVSIDEAGRGKGLLNEAGERRKIVVKKGDTIRPLFGRSARALPTPPIPLPTRSGTTSGSGWRRW